MRLLQTLAALAIVLLYSPGIAFEARRELTGEVCGPILHIDARDVLPGEVIDLDARAREGDFEHLAVDFMHEHEPVRLLEVLDAHRLRVETIRGKEVVALAGIRGTLPVLPEEVNAYIRDKAIPAIDRFLRAEGELLELRWFWWSSIWEFPDFEGRRVIQLVRRSPDGQAVYVNEELMQRGWACAAPTFMRPDEIRPHLVLSPPDLPAVGLRALGAWKAFRASQVHRIREVLALTDAELTQRALTVQARMAELFTWTPQAEIRVTWTTEGEAFDWMVKTATRLQEERAARAADEGEDDEEPIRSPEDIAARCRAWATTAQAWSPRGPMIYLVRRRWGTLAGLDVLDEILAHEIAHQYQEEVLEHAGVMSPGDELLPWEGHAGALTQAWLDDRAPGVVHWAHEIDDQEFRALIDAMGVGPDEVVEAFRSSEWGVAGLLSLRLGQTVLRDDPICPPPQVDFVSMDDRRMVIRLSNPGSTVLAGLYDGQWHQLPAEPAQERAELMDRGSSPPFHLVLPPGTSVQVKLNRHFDVSGPSVIRGRWSPTPSASPQAR